VLLHELALNLFLCSRRRTVNHNVQERTEYTFFDLSEASLQMETQLIVGE
jgi:hypothetical protein